MPVFKAPKNSVKMGVFFWPLASLFFSSFSLAQEGDGKKPCFTGLFLPPPFFTNNHQNKNRKRGWLPSPSWKTCFGPKHQKATKILHPSLKTWFSKILQNHYFYRVNMHIWPSNWPNCGPVMDSKNPQSAQLLTYNCHIDIYAVGLKCWPF